MHNPDAVAEAVLEKLNESHQLVCGDLVLMFNYNKMQDTVTISGPTTKDHRVTFRDEKLFDYVNSIADPVTAEIVLATLCDTYVRPERYPFVKRVKRS